MEHAIISVAKQENVEIIEFTVAPMVNPKDGLPYHEWFVEFGSLPSDLNTFSLKVDEAMRSKNIYYRDLVGGHILRPLVMHALHKGAFIEYMKSEGKLGGQNKVPRLSNDRKIAEKLADYFNEK